MTNNPTPPNQSNADRLADIQTKLGIDDKQWFELFGNKQGLYGLFTTEPSEAKTMPWDGYFDNFYPSKKTRHRHIIVKLSEVTIYEQ